jgi:hypothetical protein
MKLVGSSVDLSICFKKGLICQCVDFTSGAVKLDTEHKKDVRRDRH